MPESRTFSTLHVPAEVHDVLSTCILRLSVTSSDVINKLSTSIWEAFAREILVVACAWSWWRLVFEVMYYDTSVKTHDQAPILGPNSSTTWHLWVNLCYHFNTIRKYVNKTPKSVKLWESIRRMLSGRINCAAFSVWSLAPLHEYSCSGASTCLSTSHMEIASLWIEQKECSIALPLPRQPLFVEHRIKSPALGIFHRSLWTMFVSSEKVGTNYTHRAPWICDQHLTGNPKHLCSGIQNVILRLWPLP